MKGLKRVCVLSISIMMMCMAWMPAANAARDAKGFRAIWVSTVYNLDYPAKATIDEQSLKQQADIILDNTKSMGMNAVILQVRPSADAIYPSTLFPWSVYLTGAQDTGPENQFDVLAYWIDGAHKRGLELHAWINPYRITKKGSAEYQALSEKSPAKKNPGWIVHHSDGNYYFNPGIPEVRKLVLDGVQEILDNYDVDGIHLDDYFYPGTDFDDASAFKTYHADFTDLGDWRRNNVNLLIKDLHTLVHSAKPSAQFGVSPAGIWANRSSLPQGSDTFGGETYFSHYADSKKWVEEEWVDYICPQIYWNIGHEKADYETLAKWWSDVVDGTDVKLYIGMADYKAGETNPNSPWYGIQSIQQQIELNGKLSNVAGEVHFRYGLIASNASLMKYYKNVYSS